MSLRALAQSPSPGQWMTLCHFRIVMPVFLAYTAIAIRGGPTVDDVDVRVAVQVAQNSADKIERFTLVTRLLRLGIGLVSDCDFQAERISTVFGQRPAVYKPEFVRYETDEHHRMFRPFVQYEGRQGIVTETAKYRVSG
ncbi:hypothetical protein [Pseudomonas aeruginosa]|uniref:hypothetical protein n=1 Tax=Pseudomonas aeruginosa TaxID=287 RepID=UPI0034D340DC